jgi:PAS domain S-box-containing protein
MKNVIQADTLSTEQSRNLYQGLPGALVANTLFALLLIAVQIDVIAPARCFAWLASLAVVLIGRVMLVAAWQRSDVARRDGDRRWLLWFRAGTFANGLVWGAGAGWILFPSSELVHQLFLAFVLAGLGACATAVLAIDRVASCGFLALVFMPLMGRFLFEEGQIPLVMSLMLGLFWLFIDRNSRRLARGLTENSRLRAEAELREQNLRYSERNLEQAQRLAHLGSYDWDMQASKMACSTEFYRCLGLDSAPAVPNIQLLRQAIHPDDLAAVEAQQLQAMNAGGAFECVYRVVRPDGAERYLRDRSEVILDAEGQAVRMFGTIQDITKPSLALKALQASEARFRAVFESASDAVITSSDAGIIVQWNQGAEKIFGYTEQEAVGQEVDCLIPERYREAHCTGFGRAVAGGELRLKGRPIELSGRRQNGSEFPMEVSLSRWLVGDGLFFSGVIRDITERRRIESELAAHREQLESLVAARTQALTSALELAEAANRAKSVFLANMGHELRTPLNAVIGFSRMLIRANASNGDEQRKLEIIHRSGNHLLALINSVLELARIEAGRVRLQEDACNINSLIGELADIYQQKAEKSGLVFVLAANDVLSRVMVDAEKLRQVLSNLLDNAVKFTAQGSVMLGVRCARQDGQLLRLVFSISDTGVGVPPDDLPRIFEPFVQLDADATSAGTGLGLTIARQYLLMMGSQLVAKSTVGEGSEFSFSLDLRLVSEPLVPGERGLAATVGESVSAADIATLPDSLRAALCEAVSELNPGKMRQVLAQFDVDQSVLAEKISSMVDALRYQELWALLALKK